MEGTLHTDVFNCVSDVMILGDVPNDGGVIIKSYEVWGIIEELTIAAEHLKYARNGFRVTFCFTGLLIHCVLPDSVLTILLLPS